MTLPRSLSTMVAATGRATGTALAALAAVLVLAPATLAQDGAADVQRFGPKDAASSFGWRFDDLFMLIVWLTGVSFLIMMVLLLIPAIRDKARDGHKAVYDHGSSLHDKRFTAIVSVIVFIVLDAWVLVVAMRDLREGFWNVPSPEEAPNAVRVEVLAQQWAWNFRMPGVDGEFGTPDDILTLNELVVPASPEAEGNDDWFAGRPIVMNLTSKDVIHSLFLPEMRVKRDANPGAINRAWFTPIQAGDYEILCAELCGFAHYQMHGKLRVLSPEDFAAWEAEASAMAVAAYDENDTEAQWAWDWRE